MHPVERIEAQFMQHGHVAYEGARRESVSALAHALQCAQLAEWAQADATLVAAALLHDVGHFADLGAADGDAVDDDHEQRAVALLAPAFPAEVVEPIRLHVLAKRYLVAVDSRYLAVLSPASVHSLQLQGGAMSDDQRCLFEAMPFAQQAIALRRWDDSAKEVGRRTPPLAYYLPLLVELLEDAKSPRTVISSFDA